MLKNEGLEKFLKFVAILVIILIIVGTAVFIFQVQSTQNYERLENTQQKYTDIEKAIEEHS